MPCPDCSGGHVIFGPGDVAPGQITGSCEICGHRFRLHGGHLTPVPSQVAPDSSSR